MTLFLKASSLYSKWLKHSSVALQQGFFKHLGDVAAVLLD